MKVLRRVLIAVVVLVVGVPVAAVLGLSLWWHHVTTGPDVRKEVRSASVRQQRAATVDILDRTMEAFVNSAPHATRLGSSVRDQCHNEAAFFGQRPYLTCERDVRAYLAFDGDLAGLQRAWTKSLAAVHWKPTQEQMSSPYQQYSDESADPSPVRLQWSTRPTAPAPIGDFEKGIPAQDYDDQVTLEQRPVDLATVYRDGYAHHRYVVELWASARYYPAAPKAAVSPAPTPSSSWNGCFGGHNCPGG